MTTLDSPESRSHLSSVWSLSCNAPIRDIFISQQGVVAVVTESNVSLYAGAPNFGASHTLSLAPARLTAYAFSADGTVFLTGASDGFLKWWDVHNGEENAATQILLSKNDETEDTDIPPAISNISCSEESEIAAAAAGNTICIYGHEGLFLHRIGPLAAPIKSIQWNQNNELAVNIGAAISMIHVTLEKFELGPQYPAELNEGTLSSISCSPVGTMMAAGCSNGTVRIWDLASLSNGEISVFLKNFPNTTATVASAETEGTKKEVRCLAWDSSGHYLAAAGDTDVIVWDMHDNTEEEGRDNSIVCYGHQQRAKITALKFQPKGTLLATGGDDCQVLVFDSHNFNSNRVVGGLVGCVTSGRIAQCQEGSSITALAWHPSGLILAGTSLGYMQAFEITGAPENTAKVTTSSTGGQKTFLIKNNNQPKRIDSRQPSGWGGEPLISARNEDNGSEKPYVRKPKVLGNGNAAGGQGRIPSGQKPKVYLGKFKNPQPRPSFNEPPVNAGNGNWPSAMAAPNMVRWPAYQQMPPHFVHHQAGVINPYMNQNAGTPHTPESQNSEGNQRGGQNTNSQPSSGRIERNGNRNGGPPSMSHPNEHMTMGGPPGPQYPMSFMHYPSGYPMGYGPPPYAYYHMHTAVPQPNMHEAMHAGISVPGNHHTQQPTLNKTPQMMNASATNIVGGVAGAGGGAGGGTGTGTGTTQRNGKGEFALEGGSPELEESGSKSSEATNNGVNNGVTPGVPQGDGTLADGEGRPSQAQTLYVGNLASGVEESLLMQYFAPYGPVVSIQVIRDRETHTSRGFAFVTYAHPIYAQSAMQNMDSMQLLGPFEGRRLKVSFSNRR